jgi:stage V sporulation protein AD
MGCERIGSQTVQMKRPVYMMSTASVAGKKESEGPLGSLFDQVGKDDRFGEKKWEQSESRMQQMAVSMTLKKAKKKAEDVDLVLAGDLLSQSIASIFGVLGFSIPLYGLFGACSTAGEALSIGAMSIASGFAHQVLAVTSSHFATAEKQFRFPLQYASQKPLSAGWTVTASAAFLLADEQTYENGAHLLYPEERDAKQNEQPIQITQVTTGKMVDFGIRDSFHMGAAMAPAAADTIFTHFQDTSRSVCDYDRIITGDLGKIGSRVLKELLGTNGYDIAERHMDCGVSIYDAGKQDTHTGGSGCGCAASVLSAMILRKLASGEWRRVLYVPTGALLSKTSFNEGQNIPGIAHGVVLESGKGSTK